MKALSEIQRKILSYIRRYQEANGYSPSIREIGDHVNLASPSTVKYHLNVLEAREYIKRKPGAARAIKILKAA